MSLLHAVASNVLSVLTLVDNGMLLWLISWVHLRSISKIEMPSHQLPSSLFMGVKDLFVLVFKSFKFFISTKFPEFLEQLSRSKWVVRHWNGGWWA